MAVFLYRMLGAVAIWLAGLRGAEFQDSVRARVEDEAWMIGVAVQRERRSRLLRRANAKLKRAGF